MTSLAVGGGTTAKSRLLFQISELPPETERATTLALTRALIGYREAPGAERSRFEDAKTRGLTNFHREVLCSDWKRVLVTGGTGCIGAAVLKGMVDDLPGARLVAVARHRPNREGRVVGVTYLRGDVRDASRMMEIFKLERPDHVVHLAAQRDPARAESRVVKTVSTNVLGSSIVLDAAARAGVGTVVVASTGKSVRFFTSDVYAATKKLVEYQAAVAANRYGMKVAFARFTHVVDNSIIGRRLVEWVAADAPIRLHSADVLLPVQSALECYHLLMVAGRVSAAGDPKVLAMRDLGWPPVGLLDLALDYLADSRSSRSVLQFTGYPAGYEAFAYPGTYDPSTAGSVSSLINSLEADSASPTAVLGDSVDAFPVTGESSRQVDGALDQLLAAARNRWIRPTSMGGGERHASSAAGCFCRPVPPRPGSGRPGETGPNLEARSALRS